MNPKMRRIIAIIALVFVGIFTISFTLMLYNRDLLDGSITHIALFSGAVGLALFLTLKFAGVSPAAAAEEAKREAEKQEKKDGGGDKPVDGGENKAS